MIGAFLFYGSGRVVLRRPLPATTLVCLQESDATLFLNEGAIRPRDARVFGEGVEHAQRSLGVLARAVSLFEGDAEPLRDLGERA
jgi:hypothetical protein